MRMAAFTSSAEAWKGVDSRNRLRITGKFGCNNVIGNYEKGELWWGLEVVELMKRLTVNTEVYEIGRQVQGDKGN